MRRLFVVLCVLLIPLVAFACAKKIGSVSLEPKELTLKVKGETSVLTATVLDTKGNPFPGQTLLWTSSSSDVAAVDGNGVVTANSNGEATITVVAGSATAFAR